MSKPQPIVVVDARSPGTRLKLYSISLLERVLRQLHESGIHDVMILADQIRPDDLIRSDFRPRFKMNLTPIANDDVSARLGTTERVIYFVAYVAFDLTIVQRVLESIDEMVVLGPSGMVCCGSMQSTKILETKGDFVQSLESVAKEIPTFRPQDLKSYNRLLRRDITPKIWEPESENDLRMVENEMYADTFKGTMEWIAIYGYRIPVRELTRLIAKTRITPNQLTTLAICCSFLAIPAFFMGWLKTGLFLAAAFILLDSLDGKLARMTIRFSHAADRWDHLTSHPTRVAWYLGLGWSLSGHDFSMPLGLATLIYAAMPVVDKLTGVAFNAKFGRSPLDYTPLDKSVHLFTVRRNDIFLMLITLPFGILPEVYLFCTGWAVVTWLWHLFRLLWFTFKPSSGTMAAL